MRRLFVALVGCIAIAATVGIAPATGAPTVINFDDQANFTRITNQYAARGVTFTGSGV